MIAAVVGLTIRDAHAPGGGRGEFALVTPDGDDVGNVVIRDRRRRPWIWMYVHERGEGSGTLNCVVVLEDGSTRDGRACCRSPTAREIWGGPLDLAGPADGELSIGPRCVRPRDGEGSRPTADRRIGEARPAAIAEALRAVIFDGVTDGSKKAIIAALLANAGIALAKFVGFLITQSASLLAEAVHSVADTSNQAPAAARWQAGGAGG